MSDPQLKICSRCGNKYSSLNVCPECKIPLNSQDNTNQSINGSNNQALQNTGTIYGDVRQERLDAPENEIAKYQTDKTGEVGN